MPYASAADGVRLYYEESGRGTPVIFAHEFAGDIRNWEPLMKRTIPTAGIRMCPRSGHTLNLEEPDAFNAALGEFFTAVDNGRWEARDARSVAGGIIGFDRQERP